jgi:hypothetical protein
MYFLEDIPLRLTFLSTQKNNEYHFLTATEAIQVEQLVTKLELVAYKPSVFKEGGRAI